MLPHGGIALGGRRRHDGSTSTKTTTATTNNSWSVFDSIHSFPSTPESLLSQIDTSISTLERSRSNLLFCSSSPSLISSEHDERVADQAYKAARAALVAGRPDSALRSLEVALESCPADKTNALAKIRALVSVASAAKQNQNYHRQE